MKKAIALLLVVAVSLAALSASVLQLGPTVTYKNDISEIGDKHTYNDFGVGADLRLNVPYVQIKALATIGTDFQKSFSAATLAGVNLRLVQGPIEFAIGPAFGIDFRHSKEDGWTFNDYKSDEFSNIFKSMGVKWHASFGVNFSHLGLNLSAYVPTSGTIGKDLNLAPEWSKTKVAVSLLFNLF